MALRSAVSLKKMICDNASSLSERKKTLNVSVAIRTLWWQQHRYHVSSHQDGLELGRKLRIAVEQYLTHRRTQKSIEGISEIAGHLRHP